MTLKISPSNILFTGLLSLGLICGPLQKVINAQETIKQKVNDTLSINKIQELNSEELGYKIYYLNQNQSTSEWIQYYETAFDILEIKGENFETKFNNFSKSIKSNVEGGIIKGGFIFNKEKGIQNFLDIKNALLYMLTLNDHQINIEKFKKYRSFRLDNRYTSSAYFTYLERTKEREIEQEHTKQHKSAFSNFASGKITGLEFLNLSKKIKKIIYKTTDEISEKAKALEIFEKYPEYFPKNSDECYKKLIKAKKAGLQLRKTENQLYIYTSSGIFIETITLPKIDNIDGIIEKYQDVSLKDYLSGLELDQETKITPTYVTDSSHIERIKIPKWHALELSKYEKRGYKFKITLLNNYSFQIIVMKNNYVVCDVQSMEKQERNIFDLSFDILLKNLAKIEENDEAQSINIPELDIINLTQNKINFVNEVYDIFFNDDRKTLKDSLIIGDVIIENLVNIGIKHKLPLDIIFQQITLIYKGVDNKIVSENFLKNLWVFLPNNPVFLSRYSIPEKDYQKVKESFLYMSFNLWNQLIQDLPHLSLTNILDLVDHYTSAHIHFQRGDLTDTKGTNPVFKHIVSNIISINPQFYYSKEMQDLFKNYPGLKESINNGVTQKLKNQELLGNMSGGSFNDFENSGDFKAVNNIRFRIKDSWFTKFNLQLEEISSLKLIIARNLVLQNIYSIDSLQNDFNNNGKKLVQDNLVIILNERKKIQDIELFGNYDLFHLAHYGQDVGVDYIGTPVTQKALKYQGGKGSYEFFDAKNIFNKKRNEGIIKLEEFYNNFINNNNPSMLITEGHGASASFSVLQRYGSRDKLGINSIGYETIEITPNKLADIIIKRQKTRDNFSISKPDMILFAACQGDYAINFYKKLYNRKNELGNNFIFPIMMTAAEAGQSGLAQTQNLDKIIPYAMFRETLEIGKERKTTFGTFFKNHMYKKSVGSDPNGFFPVIIDGKCYIQQLG